MEKREEMTEERPARNTSPIILVHGFMGFDRLSFPEFYYWGGTWNMEEELQALGFEVYTATIGPVSSVHDRSCELYAAIKGGRVDYGAVHSEEAGHDRFGRTYPGLVPDWGEEDPETGEVKKVHLIGHSMGGQTIRYLAKQLAENGEERWIHSILSISTPHDGTPLTRYFEQPGGLIKYFAGVIASQNVSAEDPYFDLQLDHWRGATKEGESLSDFLERAVEEELWLKLKDFSYHDLSPRGAAELNQSTPALPEIYYFSISNSRTRYSELTGRWVPEMGMILPLHSSARFLGDSENDGIVPLASMDGPKAGSEDSIIPWSLEQTAIPEKGVWHHLGTFHLDHWQIHADMPLSADRPEGYDSLLDLYADIAAFLIALP